MKKALHIAVFMLVLLLVQNVQAQLNQGRPAILDEIGVDEKLGETIPLDILFTNSNGKTVTIADLMIEGKPVLLNPLYYECPILCGLVLDGVFNGVQDLRWTPGRDYIIISFSIDPSETPEQAAASKERYLAELNRPAAYDGWYFLTGDEENIKRLTDAIGFKYKYEERTGEYIHTAAIATLSPNGVITRYLYGIKFSEFDLRNALSEAVDGTIGSVLDRVVLYCFTFDPNTQSYVPVAMNIMKLGGLATLIILGIFLGVFWNRERRSSEPSKIEIQE